MRATYDVDADVLRLITDVPSATSASLLDDPDIVVDISQPDGYDIVGLLVMWASKYIPLKRGYDPAADTLLLGREAESLRVITENGDLVAYWQPDADAPDAFMDPVGVLIRNASQHFAQAAFRVPE